MHKGRQSYLLSNTLKTSKMTESSVSVSGKCLMLIIIKKKKKKGKATRATRETSET